MRNFFVIFLAVIALCELFVFVARGTKENLWFAIGLVIVAVIIFLLRGEDSEKQN